MIISEIVSKIINIDQIAIIIEVAMGTIDSTKAIILGKIGGINKEAEIGMIMMSEGRENTIIEMKNYDIKLI